MKPEAPKFRYNQIFAEYYDASPIVRRRNDLPFYLDCAKRFGDPILELGCGTGRILLPLAKAGHRICGLDISPHMLEKCREKLRHFSAHARERAQLVEGDMTRFKLRETFPLVILPFRPFQHLQTVEEHLACLRTVHQHLEPGGHLIFDLFQTDPSRMHDPRYLNESDIPGEVKLPDGRRVRLSERIAAFHRAIQANDVELIYHVTHPDGRIERLVQAFRVRYFFRYEIEHLLARCGFRVAELFGNLDRSPIRDDSPEMLFIATKEAS